jgi:hypothetical protein
MGDLEWGQGPSANGGSDLRIEDLEAAIARVTELALKSYKEGVEKILEESLAAFESRLGQIVQRIERRAPLEGSLLDQREADILGRSWLSVLGRTHHPT